MNVTMQKVHGSENDFFLIDETQLARPFTDKEIDDLRIRLCNRRSGLLGGADGLLLVEEVVKGASLAKMRVINSDGSEASMCGNGLRTVARYLAEKYDQEFFTVETMFADLKVRQAVNLAENIATYQVEISPVRFEAEAIPMETKNKTIIDEVIPELSSTLKFSAVAVPNPHLITFVDHQTIMSEEFERIATYVNKENPIFPDGINVSFVEILGENQLFVRTFERGVGFTSACGTAMCASSLMYVLLHNNEFGETITVKNTGGMVKTVVHEDDADGYWMELIGNATITHQLSGYMSDFVDGRFDQLNIQETSEQKDYLAFLKTIE
ncbi:diaminopimelate epimerase [Enterococcus sp. DIV0212c]|uniref:diaminopimelate epimerase n=1 Tax=Enterococcus sp. DIV0212c TaxID=2230867 RepID=UPI001A9AC22A|nr:diaminopimelate epimerase [Enterococcus sp. DIV0212c]MBO1354143.1 diaminopimelate epimerase [Enterococcus sp. DIV0212c]